MGLFDRASIAVSIEKRLNTPIVPNFLRYGDHQNEMIDIAELSDEALEKIGKAWTAQLIKHAQKRRKTKTI
jgi:hypothetical protein